jgi:alkylation response protein AidB-like acyl-CoA dehydrogenase
VQNTLVVNALLRWGTPDQQRHHLTRLARDTVGAYALSEAGSGSDAFALTTRATLRGDDYVLDGRKLWITNAAEAGVFIVFATLDPAPGYKGITAFLVERGTSGLTVGHKEDKLGIRASSTCELLFEGCAVPRTQLLGEAGKGYKIAIETLNEGRIGIGAQMLGLAEGALEHALRYTRSGSSSASRSPSSRGAVPARARATDIEAARLLVYNAARLRTRSSRSSRKRRCASCSRRKWPSAPRRSRSTCLAATGS